MSTHSRCTVILLSLSLVLTTTGCLISGSSRQYRSGNYVADTTFSQITPGKTNAKWLAATLGEPDHKQDLGDGTELWKWSYSERKESSGAVFLLFGASDKRETTGHAFVELHNGVVTKKWRG